MSTQLAHVYNVNRNAVGPVDIIMTPLNGQLRGRMDALNDRDYLRWKRIRTLGVPIQALWSHPPNSTSLPTEDATTTSTSDTAGTAGNDTIGHTEASTSASSGHDASSTTPADNRGEPPVPQIDQSSVIYLTADSENTLTELEEDKTYIIGGIVDHNQYKVSRASVGPGER